ncbi:hypothetical protein Aph01nite_75360 [Acrocarpospora phusangensis]|uniref:DNA polymerase III subunit gamma/tau n=1 Tax=Acrocarpospora phusangensis TaxID=1070424 RepID=A0A919QK08_9ACTN|nr:hypothetical protein Aph01nite_75360 [Acrocarpospora phusangensis]
MSLALYRKYRPGTFAEVKGQEHVTEPLRQALRSGRINHAYLFSGPRGCGKTSSARILARSLNCEQGPTPDPCGVCESCVALAPTGPGHLDVIEIDAASHGGVDDARDLRERAFFAPVSARFKIYIIDEAHMVTREGFNALLKLVEEPPPHLKFVFATTEPEKVIGTIKSRTHHYPFRLMPPATLRALMEEILESESVPYEATALPLVVRAGAGSARDSLSILDQLLAGADDAGITYQRAVSLLGYTDGDLLDEIVDAFARGDGAHVFHAVNRVIEGGHDPRRFAMDLLERFRDLVILANVPEAAGNGLLDRPADELERLQGQAASMGPAELTRAAEVFNAGLTEMRGAASPRLLLELMCARLLLPAAAAGEAALLARLERLEREGPRLSSGTAPAHGASGHGPGAVSAQGSSGHGVGTGSVQGAGMASGLGSGSAQGPRMVSGHASGGGSGTASAQASGMTQGHASGGGSGTASGQASGMTQGHASGGGSGASGQGSGMASGHGSSGAVAYEAGASAQGPGHGSAGSGASGAGSEVGGAGNVVPEPRSGASAGGRSQADDDWPVAARPGMPVEQPVAEPAPVTASGMGVVAQAWPHVLEAVKTRQRVAWMILNAQGRLLGAEGNLVTVGFEKPGDVQGFLKGKRDEVVAAALGDVLGGNWRVEIVVGSGPAGGSSRSTGVPPSSGSPGGTAPAAPQSGGSQANPRAQAHGSSAGAAGSASMSTQGTSTNGMAGGASGETSQVGVAGGAQTSTSAGSAATGVQTASSGGSPATGAQVAPSGVGSGAQAVSSGGGPGLGVQGGSASGVGATAQGGTASGVGAATRGGGAVSGTGTSGTGTAWQGAAADSGVGTSPSSASADSTSTRPSHTTTDESWPDAPSDDFDGPAPEPSHSRPTSGIAAAKSAARAAAQSGPRQSWPESIPPRKTTPTSDDSDPFADSGELSGLALLQKELGGRLIQEIDHSQP